MEQENVIFGINVVWRIPIVYYHIVLNIIDSRSNMQNLLSLTKSCQIFLSKPYTSVLPYIRGSNNLVPIDFVPKLYMTTLQFRECWESTVNIYYTPVILYTLNVTENHLVCIFGLLQVLSIKLTICIIAI
jgi:hypothetical protein